MRSVLLGRGSTRGARPAWRRPRASGASPPRRALLLILLISGCTPDFENVYLVKDLRILGVQLEPPEVLLPAGTMVFPPVHVQPLVLDPQAPGADAQFDWQLWACTADDVHCAEAAQRKLVTQARTPLSGLEADFVLDAGLGLAALQADPARGFGGVPVMLELDVRRDGFKDSAIARMVYGAPIPAEKTANANPHLARVLVDGKELPAGQPLQVGVNQTVTFLPEPAADAKESYWVATFTGGKKQLTEFLSYAFFTTAGSFSYATTGGKPSPMIDNKKIDDPSSDWTAPADPQDADLWVVIRDDRGGISWTNMKAQVR